MFRIYIVDKLEEAMFYNLHDKRTLANVYKSCSKWELYILRISWGFWKNRIGFKDLKYWLLKKEDEEKLDSKTVNMLRLSPLIPFKWIAKP